MGLEPGIGEETLNSFIQFIHSEDLHVVSEQLERALSQCSIYQADFRIVRADTQEIRWMSGYGRVIETQNGRATRMSGVMFDCPDTKKHRLVNFICKLPKPRFRARSKPIFRRSIANDECG